MTFFLISRLWKIIPDFRATRILSGPARKFPGVWSLCFCSSSKPVIKRVESCQLKHLSRDMTNQQNECAPSEDSDQPGHPFSLIRVFAARMKKPWVLSYPLSAQRRLCSDCADAQTDLSLRSAHSHFVGFVMSRLIYVNRMHCVEQVTAVSRNNPDII